jgi:hypothetical protein
MSLKQQRWLDTHVEVFEEYYRDVPLKGLAKDLIDQDIEFLKDLWQDWTE